MWYSGSVPEMLADVFPEHKWHFHKFHRVQPGYWSDRKNQLAFMDWMKEELGISSYEEMYRITHKQITELGGMF